MKEDLEGKKNRIIYIDILNIIAIIAVLALHCNGIVHGNPNTRSWETSLIVECLCYFAVPLFCMLSGATLMNYRKKYDTKTFFRKRIIKVAIPFIFWAIIMFLWKISTNRIDPLQYKTLADWINAFFSNREESTYYFMFTIMGLYLTMPLFSLMANEKCRKGLWLTVLLFFIFNAFLPNVLGLLKVQYNTNLSVNIGSYTIFIILGYLLSTQNIQKKHRILIYVGAIIGLIYRYLTTFVLSKEAGYVVKTTWGYSSWHSILLASSVLLFIKNLKVNYKLNKYEKYITSIAGCSFGIYLIHQIIMYYEINIFNINISSWEWRTIGIITTYLISLLMVFIIKKVPILKKVVP